MTPAGDEPGGDARDGRGPAAPSSSQRRDDAEEGEEPDPDQAAVSDRRTATMPSTAA